MSAYKSAGSRTTTGFASFQSSVLAEKLGFEFPHQLKFYTSVNGQPALLSSLTIHKTIRSDGVVKWIQDNMHFLEYKAVHQLNFEEEELVASQRCCSVAKTFHSCESAQHTVDSMNLMRAYLEEAKLSCLLQHNKNEKLWIVVPLFTPTTSASEQQNKVQWSKAATQRINVCWSTKLLIKNYSTVKCCAHYASNNKWSNTYKKPFHFSLGWKSKQSCRFLRLMRKTQSEILKGYNTETKYRCQSDHSLIKEKRKF
uniref:Uncharacterized protein n=1 Tax=Ditylenchus dipsaci TaxID=166011 RepID=A0A915CNU3_9BILA